MTSSVEKFWNSVGHWEKDQPKIVLEISGSRPPVAMTFTGTVARVDGVSVVFWDVEAEAERPVNFLGASIRSHSFERLDAVCCFVALWEDAETLESVRCLLTELRDFGKPN